MLTIGTEDPDQLVALTDWLRREPELRGVRLERLGAAPAPGEMGGGADAVRLVSDNKELLGAVATTIGIWLTTRTRRTRISVQYGKKKVEIDTGRIKDPDEVARRILRDLQKDDD
jgi:hypothetical protein